MDSRTQWEIAGVTVALAVIAGAYTLGITASNDTVKQLENSLASYEKAKSLNTEEFLNSAVSAANSLKISIEERKKLSEQELINKELQTKIHAQKVKIASFESTISKNASTLEALINKHSMNMESQNAEHNRLIAAKDTEIKILSSKLKEYESKARKFTLSKGGGISLQNGSIQVGYSSVEYSTNICDVSINNEHKKMKAGDFVSINSCKVILTMCVYEVSDAPANFELVCS